MATKTFSPILGKRLRVTEVDNCGRVIPGPVGMSLTTDGFVTVTLSAEVEDGVEIITRNASGNLCVNEKYANSFKYFGIEIEFCGVNPSLLSMTTNAEEYLDADGDVIGFTVAEGEIKKYFALELWTGLSGVACDDSMEEASGYMLLPFVVAGTIGEITVDGENAVTFSMTGANTKGGNVWGSGPYNVIQDAEGTGAPLPTPLDSADHFLMALTGVAVPPVADDPTDNPSSGG